MGELLTGANLAQQVDAPVMLGMFQSGNDEIYFFAGSALPRQWCRRQLPLRFKPDLAQDVTNNATHGGKVINHKNTHVRLA